MSFKNQSERRANLRVEARRLMNLGGSENLDKAAKIIDELGVISRDIDNLRKLNAMDREDSSFVPSPRHGVGATGHMSNDERRDKTNKAFRSYALHGFAGMQHEERALLTTADGTGGALIPDQFLGSLIEAQKYYGPVASLVRQRRTNNNGAPLKISLANDTGNGITLLATEGTSSPAETDPAFQSKVLGVDTVTGGLVKVSFQELEDSYFDLDVWLREAFGKRYARGLETAVTTGKDGAGTTLPNVSSLASQAVVGTTTTILANGIGWTDLVNLFAALDPAYLANPKWVMNSATRAYLLGLKDGFGRPYWTPDPSADGPFSKLLGYDVVLDQAMPNMGAGAKPILFGSLQDAYLLRSEGQPFLLRLNERFADQLEVGFYLYSRIGGTSIVATGAPNPLVSLQQAAS